MRGICVTQFFYYCISIFNIIRILGTICVAVIRYCVVVHPFLVTAVPVSPAFLLA